MLYKSLRKMPWALRLLLFALLAAPLVDMRLITMWAADDTIARIMAKAAYAAFIWGFIMACVGLDKFFTYAAAAFLMFVATVTVGASVGELLGFIGKTDEQKQAFHEQSLAVGFMLTISIPYFCFVIQAFSASRLLERISDKAGTANRFQMNLAVCLRVFQHLTEMMPALLVVWKEENPFVLLPRHTDDWRSQHIIKRILSLLDWGFSAAMIWARCLLIFSLRIVPVVEIETKRLAQPK